MQGLKATTGNQGLGAIVEPVAIMAGMGVLFFLLSLSKGIFRLNVTKPALAEAQRQA